MTTSLPAIAWSLGHEGGAHALEFVEFGDALKRDLARDDVKAAAAAQAQRIAPFEDCASKIASHGSYLLPCDA